MFKSLDAQVFQWRHDLLPWALHLDCSNVDCVCNGETFVVVAAVAVTTSASASAATATVANKATLESKSLLFI